MSAKVRAEIRKSSLLWVYMETYPGTAPEAADDDDDDEEAADSGGSDKGSDQKEQKQTSDESKNDSKPPEKPESKDVEEDQHDVNLPVEKLDDTEKKLLANEYVQARQDEVGEELSGATAETPEEAEVLANAALLEIINDKLAGGEQPSEAALDEAVAETMDELGLEQPEESESEEAESDADTEAAFSQNAESAPSEAVPEEAEGTEESIDPVAAQNTPAPPPTTTIPVVPIASANTNTNTPGPGNPNIPQPNVNTVLPPSPGGRRGSRLPPFIPFGGGGGGGGANFNIPNALNVAAASPNIAPNLPNTVERRSAALPYLVVGYLLGRRRGRINTEKKLMPVQKKLEKEVSDLHKSIATREEKIRLHVREQVAAKPATTERIVERLENRRDRKNILAQAAVINAAKVPGKISDKRPSVTERALGRPEKTVDRSSTSGNEAVLTAAAIPAELLAVAAAEAVKESPARPEHLGKFALTNEKSASGSGRERPPNTESLAPAREALTVPSIPEIIKVPEKPKSVETMMLPDLLLIAARIPTEHSTVKKLYKSNRIDEVGLRRVAKAYLRGENYEKVLRDNLKSREKPVLGQGSEQEPADQNGISRGKRGGAARAAGLAFLTRGKSDKRINSASLSNGNIRQPDQNTASENKSSKALPIATALMIIALLALLLLR